MKKTIMTIKEWAAAKKLGTFMGFVGVTVFAFVGWLEHPVSWILIGLSALSGGLAAVASTMLTWLIIDITTSLIVNVWAILRKMNATLGSFIFGY